MPSTKNPDPRVQARPWRWWLAAGFDHPDFVSRLAAPHRLLQPPAEPVERIPPRTATELVRLALPELPAQPLFIKHYMPADFWNTCKDMFRRSRARRAFENALTLQSIGLRTAPPVACGEQRRWLRLREAFLICVEVPQAVTLHDFYRAVTDPRRRLIALVSLMGSRPIR